MAQLCHTRTATRTHTHTHIRVIIDNERSHRDELHNVNHLGMKGERERESERLSQKCDYHACVCVCVCSFIILEVYSNDHPNDIVDEQSISCRLVD